MDIGWVKILKVGYVEALKRALIQTWNKRLRTCIDDKEYDFKYLLKIVVYLYFGRLLVIQCLLQHIFLSK